MHQNNNIGLQNIFSVPIYTTFLNREIIEGVENLIIPRLNNLELSKEQKTDYFKKDKIATSKELSSFFYHIDPIISKYSNSSNLKRSSNYYYWIQDYSKNEFHHLHAHGDSYISGVYYIRANKNAGALKFTNPNPLFSITSFNDNPKEEIYYKVKPQKGLLVLFPGWLSHEAIPSLEKDCIRTCLAFNIFK